MRAFVVAEQVRILIQNGHIEEAESAFAAGDPGVDEEPVPTLRPTRRNESVAIAWLRLEMQRHRLVRARKVAKRWLEFVKHSGAVRSEEHTSELQSLMRISYAVFCLKKKTRHNYRPRDTSQPQIL